MKESNRRAGGRAGTCSAFHICFDFLSRIFLSVPDEASMTKAVEEGLFLEYPLPKDQAVREGLALLRVFCEKWSPDQMEALKSDYTRLFFGIQRMLAPPYASVHLSEERLLFERQTREAREFYGRFDLRVPKMHRVPDDHIGFELSFLSFLCRKAAGGTRAGNNSGLNVYLETAREFLSGHLLLWLDSFVSDIERNAATLYFRGLGLLLQGTVKQFAGFLQIPA